MAMLSVLVLSFLAVVPALMLEVHNAGLEHELAIVSASFGSRAGKTLSLRSFPEGFSGVPCFLFTDKNITSQGSWTVVHSKYHEKAVPLGDNGKEGDTRSSNAQERWRRIMTAKFYKMNAHLLPELLPYKKLFWMDAYFLDPNSREAYGLVSQGFLNGRVIDDVRRYMGSSDVLMAYHPARPTVQSELGPACHRAGQATGSISDEFRCNRSYVHFRKQGFKDESGMFWCGMFVLNTRSDRVRKAFNFWWQMNKEYTFRDQLSWPFAVQQHDLNVTSMVKEYLADALQASNLRKKLWPTPSKRGERVNGVTGLSGIGCSPVRSGDELPCLRASKPYNRTKVH